MDALSYKTVMLTPKTVNRTWWIVDAEGLILGRMASQVAMLLRGKNKPSYTPHINCGDKVIIINAEKVALTGKKMDKRIHLHHTGYPGGQRAKTPREILQRTPTRLIEHAIKMMLPKTVLGSDLYRNLYVYAGTKHPHEAQNPKPFKPTI